jgi:hypothetical protein
MSALTLCGTLAFNADTVTLAKAEWCLGLPGLLHLAYVRAALPHKAGTYSGFPPLQAGCRSMSHVIFLQQVSHALQRRPLYCYLRLDMHSHALDKL